MGARHWASAIFSDCVKALGPASVSIMQGAGPHLLKECQADDANNRRNAAFAIGVCCEFGGAVRATQPPLTPPPGPPMRPPHTPRRTPTCCCSVDIRCKPVPELGFEKAKANQYLMGR